MRRTVVILLFLVCSLSSWAQQTEDEYKSQISAAIEKENLSRAVDLAREGEQKWPVDPYFPRILGRLYSGKDLYKAALDAYLRADKLLPGNRDILQGIADSYGKLGMDAQSTEVFERIYNAFPDDPDSVSDLGWMYFKTFQLGKAEILLLDGIEQFPEDPGIYMTLGTVYAGKYQYLESRKYYLKSVELALDQNWHYFAAVAYYNLSILEEGFYHYDRSMEYTDRSLELVDRSSGHIARGELYQQALEYQKAADEYETAVAAGDNPLGLINQADLAWSSGDLDAALATALQVYKETDLSWIYYFGTDTDRHFQDLHQLLEKIYRSLNFREKKLPDSRLRGWFNNAVTRTRYSALAWYHGRKARTLALKIGRSYLQDGNSIDGYYNLYMGTRGSRRGLGYLRRAEEAETALIPEASSWYDVKTGELLKDRVLLADAYDKLDPHWEGEFAVETLGVLAELTGPASASGIQVRQMIYERNPGYFPGHPISMVFAADASLPGWLKRGLKRSGIVFVKPDESRYTLSWQQGLVVHSPGGIRIIESGGTGSKQSDMLRDIVLRLYSDE